MPYYALVFMIFTMASVGLPGTSGFVGEFLVMVGAYKVNSWLAFGAATGMVLGAAYMLWLYRRVVFGELRHKDLMTIVDLNKREIAIFLPLIILVLWMGVYPSSFSDFIHVSVDHLIHPHGFEAPQLIASGEAGL
jgi:NADH-quinone oxidoreductase subunit M